jgi:hypothetical protein
MSILETLASKAFPEGRLQEIKANAPSQFDYNVQATRDLVQNQPFNPLAPGMALTASLPYDTIQGIQRAFKGFEPQTGILDYDEIPDAPTFRDIGKSIAAENPIDSLIGRTYGAILGTGDKLTSMGKTVKDVFSGSAFAKEPDNIEDFIEAAKVREALNQQGLMALDDAGLVTPAYEDFAQVAKPGFNLGFAKQLGKQALTGILSAFNPVAGLIARGLSGMPGRVGVQGGVALRGDTNLDTFARSTSLADFAQRMRDKRAREAAAQRGSLKDLQDRIDRGKFDGGNKDDAPGGAAANQDAARGGQYER